jgi:membrane protein YdbS with pleckstrin-like domain
MVQEQRNDAITWFPSKVDWWIGLLLLVGPTVALGSFVALLLTNEDWWIGLLMVVFVAGVYAGLVIPIRYGIDEQGLTVRNGIVSQRIPLERIQSVRPSRNPLSSPALSLARLQVRYGTRFWQFVLISPADRSRFLALLAESAGLQRDGDTLRLRDSYPRLSE